MSSDRFKELGFQEGDTLVVSPKKARVFLQAQPA
jgi:sulfate transport system ATP-binding protein